MRFKITKNNKGTIRSIVVSGEMDEEAGWDILQIAQTMLNQPSCRELVIDVRSALIPEDFAVFTTDTLLSVFEMTLLTKDSAVVIRYRYNNEIRLCSDQLPCEPPANFTGVSNSEAKFLGKAMKWLEFETRLVIN